MKKIIPLFFLLVFSVNIVAQDLDEADEELILKKLEQYFKLMTEKNYEGMMEYVYPKVFTIVPKQQMVAAFTEALVGMEFSFSNMEILWVEGIYKQDYGLVKYSTEIEVILESEDVKNEMALNAMSGFMKTQKGVSNVESDKENFMITMDARKYILAINESEYDGWNFIEFDENSPQMLQLLLSRDLIQEVKNRISKDQ